MGLSFLINKDQLQVLADRKVIKHAEFTSVVNAKGLLYAAHEESLRLIERAGTEVEQQRERGYREGWEQAQKRLADELTRVAAQRAHELLEQRRTMAQAALAVARELVGSLDSKVFFDEALRRVSEKVRAEQFLSIRVASDDIASARVAVQRLMDRYGSTRFVNVLGDATLTPRSCVIESALGTVDVGLDSFMQRLELVLTETFVTAQQADTGLADNSTAA